jgi:hypothetical protein
MVAFPDAAGPRPPSYAALDEALEQLAGLGPDLANGLTSHAPMAVEALCAMGRPDAVAPWLAVYRSGMLPRPAARERLDASRWREALGRPDLFAEWSELFRQELREAPWRAVLRHWMPRLAPGLCGSATHGVLRVGHAVRGLGVGESPPRLHELADALGYMAANHQELPAAPGAADAGLSAAEAIRRVAMVPADQRRFDGTITSSLAALDDFPAFAPVIGLLDVRGDANALVSDLTETFARVYLANAHDLLSAIVFIHGVTSAATLRNLLPLLDAETGRYALRFTWQAGCGLYAAFGRRPSAAEPAVTGGRKPRARHARRRARSSSPGPACASALRHAPLSRRRSTRRGAGAAAVKPLPPSGAP